MDSAHQWILCTVHETYKSHFLVTFSLKIGFWYYSLFKNYFTTIFLVLSKINGIQTLTYYTKKLTGIFARKFSYLEKRKKKKEKGNGKQNTEYTEMAF